MKKKLMCVLACLGLLLGFISVANAGYFNYAAVAATNSNTLQNWSHEYARLYNYYGSGADGYDAYYYSWFAWYYADDALYYADAAYYGGLSYEAPPYGYNAYLYALYAEYYSYLAVSYNWDHYLTFGWPATSAYYADLAGAYAGIAGYYGAVASILTLN